MANGETVKTNCPVCGMVDSLSFWEGTENGAPYGAGYWPMPVSDSEQACNCPLTSAEWEAAQREAWGAFKAPDDYVLPTAEEDLEDLPF